ncbi:MAG: ComF family protein [Clostridia bacterium]|nr:ComF family protein [Clostridia bacterium]
MNLYAWGEAAASLFFPQRYCVGCGAPSPGQPLCPACHSAMLAGRSCPRCASFIAASETAAYLCPECRHKQPAFSAASAALPYAGHLRQVLIAFKYEQKTGYRRPLARLLIEQYQMHCGDYACDAVTPVPLHARRLRERGYNQAELLSALFAAATGLPHHPELLSRRGETPPLAELSRRERIKALRGVFEASPGALGLRILLIDDIFTSGATLESCSRALLAAGAAEIRCLTVAAGQALP